MFPFQHPEDYLRAFAADRERMELRSRLLRELRGATPPFGEGLTRRLAAAMAAPQTPCPEAKEAMST